MKFILLPGLLGVAAIGFLSAPVQAAVFEVGSGVTSVSLDPNVFKVTGANPTGQAAPGFAVGFNILSPSSDSSVLGTSFKFDVTGSTITVLPGGNIEHSGDVSFNLDSTVFPLFPNPTTVGNFTVTSSQSGISVIDNFTTGAGLFDVQATSSSFDGNALTLTGNLLVSEDLDTILKFSTNDPDSYKSLKGAVVGQVQINANKVPEPGTVAGLFALTGAAVALRRRQRLGTR